MSPLAWDVASPARLESEWFEEARPAESIWPRLFRSFGSVKTWHRLREFVGSGARVLEVGFGRGALLRYLKGQGLDVEGCDLSRGMCAYVTSRYGIPTHACALHEMPEDRQYDLIVANHVVEHVSNPGAFVTAVRNRLAPSGVLHLAVPNVACWQARLPGWGGYEPYHLLYFSPHTLRRLVEDAGLAVLRVATHDSFSGWFLSIVRTLLSAQSKGLGERRSLHHRVHSTLLGHAYHLAMVLTGLVTFPLRCVQGVIGAGDEIVLVARRAK